MLRCWLAIVAVAAASVCLGTDNIGKWADRGIELRVGMSSHPREALVSGTNVNCVFTANWGALADPPSGVEVPVAKVLSLRIQCEDLDYTQNATVNPPTGSSLAKTVRIASTHFNDGSPITFTVTGKFELKDSSGTTEVTKVWQPSVKAYNKGLTLATKEEFFDPPIDNSTNPPTDLPEGYYVHNPPFPDGYAKASQDAMPDARAGLSPPYHTILNQSDFLTEAELAPLLKQATAFFGFTHGEPTNFRASMIDQLYFAPPTNEVATYVQGGRTALPFNIVVMHACSTLAGSGNGQWKAPYAFNLAIPDAVEIPNRVYAGFMKVVWSITQKNFSIREHAKVVYDQLRAGRNIKDALAKANDQIRPKGQNGKLLHMIPRGDLWAKLFNVYLSKSEWTEERDSKWFVVF